MPSVGYKSWVSGCGHDQKGSISQQLVTRMPWQFVNPCIVYLLDLENQLSSQFSGLYRGLGTRLEFIKLLGRLYSKQ